MPSLDTLTGAILVCSGGGVNGLMNTTLGENKRRSTGGREH